METLLNIFWTVLGFVFVFSIYMIHRCLAISKLRQDIMDMCLEAPNYQTALNVYRSVSYDKMLYSFKPIKMESFYTQRQIEIITSGLHVADMTIANRKIS